MSSEELYNQIYDAVQKALVELEKQGFSYKDLSWVGQWKKKS